ncbi:50S ribosomal protein L18 [Candidatus Synchoanobacter obligatus]|uniref:50S ribosomal protein L18 n=1 Tax=Candidatus Synchoanobacter obligatus TaxID=2919597 RepID=A0ABT1L5S7_9GAMM|nr:50S ribosomal protein L18 [Candidatus Synchoanobacter obligatus]MCP8352502.1 50S ribosomal protein L18 [Candidatus Synchoanobacter obligatus]
MSKLKSRVRDRVKRKSRARLAGKDRIIITRSNRHIRVQVVNLNGRVLGGVSTLTPAVKKKISYTGNKEAAKEVGMALAAVIKKLKLTDNLAFDRSGYVYHGRVAMVAEGLRAAKIKI